MRQKYDGRRKYAESYDSDEAHFSILDNIMYCVGMPPDYDEDRQYSTDDSYDSSDSSEERRRRKKKKKKKKSKSKPRGRSKSTRHTDFSSYSEDETRIEQEQQSKPAVDNFTSYQSMNQSGMMFPSPFLSQIPNSSRMDFMLQQSLKNNEPQPQTNLEQQMEEMRMQIQQMKEMQEMQSRMQTPAQALQHHNPMMIQPDFHGPPVRLNLNEGSGSRNHHKLKPFTTRSQGRPMPGGDSNNTMHTRSKNSLGLQQQDLQYQQQIEEEQERQRQREELEIRQKQLEEQQRQQERQQKELQEREQMLLRKQEDQEKMIQKQRQRQQQQRKLQQKQHELRGTPYMEQQQKEASNSLKHLQSMSEDDPRGRADKYKTATSTHTKSVRALNEELVTEDGELFQTVIPAGEVGLTIAKTAAGLTILRIADNSVASDLNPGDIIIGLDGVDVSHIYFFIIRV